MKKIISLVITLAIIAAGLYFVPKVLHICDDCGNFFVGIGYEPNAVEAFLSEEEMVICKECAEQQHVAAIVMGKSIHDFQKELF